MTIQESLQNAEEAIKPYLITFKECYTKAIVKYNAFLDFFAAPLYNRTKAIIFQNIIVNEIKQAVSNMAEISIFEKYESISLIIDNHISARFKKLNEKGLPSNHHSIRNDAIVSQQLEIGFLEYPPIARIDVGYNMDVTGTNYELLKVICRKNNEILWDLYFHDIVEGENIHIVTNNVKPLTAPENTQPRITINKEYKKAK